MIRSVLYILLFFPITLNAQYENVWQFGANAGLDFNGGAPVAIHGSMSSNEACASVCNAAGALLFYTDGSSVWHANGNTMSNGFNLTGLGPDATESSSQGTIIVPMPDSPSKFYIFSLIEFERGAYLGRLYYSVVNLALNSGSGGVEAGRKGILLDSLLTEHMTSAAGNSCNVWLLVISQQGVLKAYSIDYSGINPAPALSSVSVTNPGPGANPDDGPVGYMDVSPDRRKLAIARGKLALFDFDAGTGAVSNPVVLSAVNNPLYYGVCFSPDNSRLYASDNFRTPSVHQFTVSADETSMRNSKTQLVAGTKPSAMKRGPDGRIYVARFDNADALDVIVLPDAPGISCQYTPGGLPLASGSYSRAGLPNAISVPAYTDTQTATTSTIACFTDQATLHAQHTAAAYTWHTGDTGAYYTAASSGTCWVTYARACTFYVDTFHIAFVQPRLHTLGACIHDTNGRAWIARDPGDTIACAYVWRNAAGDTLSLTDSLVHVPAGDYTVRITTASGCDTTIRFHLPEVSDTVSFTADTPACAGEMIRFQNTSDTGFNRYFWDFGNGDSSLLENPTYTYGHAGSYRVMLRGEGARCADTAYRTVVVDSLFYTSFTADRDSLCAGGSVLFSPDHTPGKGYLRWDFGDGSAPVTGGAQAHAYDRSGMMVVTLTARHPHCPDTTAQDTIYVFPYPVVALGPDTALCPGMPPLLLVNSAEAEDDGSSYTWSTGSRDWHITTDQPGSYFLTVTSSFGCAVTDSIIVRRSCHIGIPNVFTPNGDGANDYFFPRDLLAAGLTYFRMQVFNRWGQVVFETSRISGRGWDGRLNGTEQPQGVYIYLVEVSYANGTSEKYRGNVTLIR